MQAVLRVTAAFALSAISLIAGTCRTRASGLQIIYDFSGGAGYRSPPGSPLQGPVFDPTGNLVGSTSYGGSGGYGTVYRISPTGQLLGELSFSGRAFPNASPLLDPAGDVFIASDNVKLKNDVYIRTPDGQTEEIPIGLNFINGPFILDQQGDLVATSNAGSGGVVFSVSLRTRTTTILHYFPDQYAGDGADGYYPGEGSLAMDKQGNLYGAVEGGGPLGGGTIFRLTPSGVETTFYGFAAPSNCNSPSGGLVFDAAGNLYGTTGLHSSYACIFKISPSGQFTLLHQFLAPTEGYGPHGGLIFDAQGNLYGTTASGGSQQGGTLFKLAPDGTFTVLYSFYYAGDSVQSVNGYFPNYGLATDAAGNIYGTTLYGGLSFGSGVLFKFAQ